jgi:DNA-binding ferritin-like protein
LKDGARLIAGLRSAAALLNIFEHYKKGKVMAKTNQGKSEVAAFLGELISFRNSLKLIHWSITGLGSYEAHISLDQAIESLADITDRLVETSFALKGTLEISIPETIRPKEYIKHIEGFYKQVEDKRKSLFSESFSQSIIDDGQEAIQQLLFRLKRLE